ncbi:MAG: hypothetical protein IPH36_13275 [Saprospiraceae bacterium]|nr:hypothetical protein [Saprospiraceae bacterium]
MRSVIALLLVIPTLLQGQTMIAIQNRSFEDIPRQGNGDIRLPINGWYDCGAIRFRARHHPIFIRET